MSRATSCGCTAGTRDPECDRVHREHYDAEERGVDVALVAPTVRSLLERCLVPPCAHTKGQESCSTCDTMDSPECPLCHETMTLDLCSDRPTEGEVGVCNSCAQEVLAQLAALVLRAETNSPQKGPGSAEPHPAPPREVSDGKEAGGEPSAPVLRLYDGCSYILPAAMAEKIRASSDKARTQALRALVTQWRKPSGVGDFSNEANAAYFDGKVAATIACANDLEAVLAPPALVVPPLSPDRLAELKRKWDEVTRSGPRPVIVSTCQNDACWLDPNHLGPCAPFDPHEKHSEKCRLAANDPDCPATGCAALEGAVGNCGDASCASARGSPFPGNLHAYGFCSARPKWKHVQPGGNA